VPTELDRVGVDRPAEVDPREREDDRLGVSEAPREVIGDERLNVGKEPEEDRVLMEDPGDVV
jgi:hypothetical protein